MKNKSSCLLLVLALFAGVGRAGAQGSLTPPGAPAPTMKTLAQIEPRTPISSLPYSITNPGSYYLTTNLTGVSGTNGITISSGNVNLDLRGFTLAGAPGTLNGILAVGGVTNVTVENGTVDGWGAYGVNADGAIGGQFVRLNISGSRYDGLDAGQNCVMRQCTASGNTENGFGILSQCFQCTFEDCASIGNGGGFVSSYQCSFLNCRADANVNDGFDPGYQCKLKDCTADFNGSWGIWDPYPGCLATGCVADSNGGNGMTLDHSVLNSCTATYNGNDGMDAGSGSTLAGCVAYDNGGDGINAATNCALTDCSADTNSLDNIVTAFGCTLNHCAASYSGTGDGFNLGPGNTITGSSAFGNAVNGIDANSRTTVQGCTVNFNGNAGIHADYLGNVQQCSCFNNGVYGILSDANGYASILQNNCSFNGLLTFGGTPARGAGICLTNSPGCRVEGNTLNLNYAALVVAANSHALILRNSAQGNFSASYSIAGGNSWGPIVDVSAGGDISGVANSSHPDANFIH